MVEKSKNNHKFTGMFEFYLLNSINLAPKSGYDIISEIKSKSDGTIVASKGTIYPLLSSLESKGIIKGEDSGVRSKRLFCLTKKGKLFLKNLVEEQIKFHKKMIYMPLLFKEFRKLSDNILDLLFTIKCLSLENKNDVAVRKILLDCVEKLKEVKNESD